MQRWATVSSGTQPTLALAARPAQAHAHAVELPYPYPYPSPMHKAECRWAVLIARIDEVFPLLCPMCGGQMRLIAFITEGMQIRKILDHSAYRVAPPETPSLCPIRW
jgi:hypothetical protein